MLESLLQFLILTPLLIATVAFVGGLIPVGPIKIVLIILSYQVLTNSLFMLVVIVTLSCLFAKILIYYIGDCTTLILPVFMKNKLTYYQSVLKTKRRISASMLIISAMIGIPPYYIINVISGMLRVNFNVFLMLSFLGFFIRFSLVIFLPKVFLNGYYFFMGR